MNATTLYTFLDAMTCALGGVLVVFFADMNHSADSIANLQATLDTHYTDMRMIAQIKGARDTAVSKSQRLEGEVSLVRSQLTAAESREQLAIKQNGTLQADLSNALAVNQQQAADIKAAKDAQALLDTQLRVAEKKQAELAGSNQALIADNVALANARRNEAHQVIGLNGEFKRVLFVFDASDSMKVREDLIKNLFAAWIEYLGCDEFNVMKFSTDVELWNSEWQVATEHNRRSAGSYVRAIQLGGVTSTKAALTRALELDGIDTIIIVTDGAPSDGSPQEIFQAIRPAYRNSIAINVVAMGNYFKEEYGDFLRKLAADHGGVFIGR